MFESVDPKQNFVELEHRVLEFWERERIFDRLREQLAGKKNWSFIDGPMTANNPMGVHHAWGRTYKDVFQRHKAMEGFDQRWQNGFDCQGLWLEVETEKELGFNSKKDIEDHGLDHFSRACRARVEKFSDVQTDQSIRLGQWMRWDDSYYTMTDLNIEYIWHFLKVCHDQGWLYQSHRSMPWCTRCGTSLSQHELADGYEEIADTAVYLRFPLKGREAESLLVWTTTPWTLSSNVAAAVHPELTYARVRFEDHVYYVSAALVETLFRGKGEVLETLKGLEMLGWEYSGPYDEFPAVHNVRHQIISWDEVGEDEGTGIVHIAPGCGAEDYQLSKEHNLAVLAPLKGDGTYVDGFGWQTGQDVHTQEKPVLDDLKRKGLHFRQETYKHRYPFCWRCKSKLVFRVVYEWFISCEEIRPLMQAEARNVQWIPESVGKRTQDWYTNMGDWCISRKRYWGLPLPFYFCKDGHFTIVSSVKELREKAVDPSVVDELPELHRPWIDEVKIKCHCGDEAHRITDVGDCWLDAGIVGFSTLKYFEDREYWEKWYPAELVVEMREQVRLWFYAMMFTGVALEGRAPYKRVFSYEKVYDEKGKPMHKSAGNAIWFDEAAEKMGVDVMRWLYCAFNPNNNLRFGYKIADEIRKKLITLWNVYGFFVTYAKIDGFDPREHDVAGTLGKSPNSLDRWILSALYRTVSDCRKGLDECDVAFSLRRVDLFLDELSTWYVRRSRRRFWKSATEGDEDKAFAYRTLFHVLVTMSEVLAPFVPFVTEEIYRNLSRPFREAGEWPESVHLRPYPVVREDLIDDELNARIDRVLRAVSLGRSAREKVQIKVRQPLGQMWLVDLDQEAGVLDGECFAQIGEELNVKSVVPDAAAQERVERQVKLNFPVLGARLGPNMKKVAAAVKAGQWTMDEDGSLRVETETIGRDEYEMQYVGKDGVAAANDRGLLVVLDTTISEDLRREGYAREIVRIVQDLRKQAGYNVDDRIRLHYDHAANGSSDDAVAELFDSQGSYIGSETLADSLSRGKGDVDQSQELELEKGLKVWLGVCRSD